MALNQSRHVVLLWTAKDVETALWRSAELSFFNDIFIRDSSRRIIPVLLEGQDSDFPKLHSNLQRIQVQHLYSKAIEQVSPVEWTQMIIDKIVPGLQNTPLGIPIKLAVLTGTKAEIETIDFKQKVNSKETLDEILQQNPYKLGKEQIVECYGNTRRDWKPFSGKATIQELLENLLSTINISMLDRKIFYRWEEIDDETTFWTNDDTATHEASKLKTDPAVLIIDPIALLVPNVLDRWNFCNDVMDNREAAVMAFSPFSNDFFSWCKIIERKANPLYKKYYRPDLLRIRDLPQLCIHTIQPEDASRYVRFSISSSFASSRASEPRSFTSMR